MADETDLTLDTSGTGSSDQTTTDSTTTSASDATSAAASSQDSVTPAASANDPGQPYLFVDLYSGDDARLVGKHPNWPILASTSGYFGAILKAWDGTRFNDGGWFQKNWPAVRDAGGDRYGDAWFRGAYLFLEFLQNQLKELRTAR